MDGEAEHRGKPVVRQDSQGAARQVLKRLVGFGARHQEKDERRVKSVLELKEQVHLRIFLVERLDFRWDDFRCVPLFFANGFSWNFGALLSPFLPADVAEELRAPVAAAAVAVPGFAAVFLPTIGDVTLRELTPNSNGTGGEAVEEVGAVALTPLKGASLCADNNVKGAFGSPFLCAAAGFGVDASSSSELFADGPVPAPPSDRTGVLGNTFDPATRDEALLSSRNEGSSPPTGGRPTKDALAPRTEDQNDLEGSWFLFFPDLLPDLLPALFDE